MARLQEVRRTVVVPRTITATAWTPVMPLKQRRLDAKVTLELLHYSRRQDPSRFERCGCSQLLLLVNHAKAKGLRSITVKVTDERVTENGVKMLRFRYNGKTFETGERCFEEAELSS